VRSAPVPLEDPATVETVNSVFAELAERARADIRASGLDPAAAEMRHGVEMRYIGQMNEVPLPWPAGRIDAADVPSLRSAFERLYEQRYGTGTFRRQSPLEIINFRAEAVIATEKPRLAPLFADTGHAPALRRNRPVYMRKSGWIDAAIHAYGDLSPDAPIAGPAIIERESTTIWLPPGARATLDVYGNLAIDLEA
jgi:N-methylhydantoinase A/oxoprolinase/acetone carboxylase beta subunit